MNTDTLNYVIGAIALVAGAMSTMLLGTLKTVRDSNSDLRSRVGDLEDKNRALTAEVVLLKSDRDALARNVRGDDHFEQYGQKIDAHHVEATEHWELAEGFLDKILAMLAAMRDRLPGGPA